MFTGTFYSSIFFLFLKDEKFEKCKIFITTVGRVCNQLDGYFPETVKCVVVNNLDLISADNRQKIIMFFQTRNVQVLFDQAHIFLVI